MDRCFNILAIGFLSCMFIVATATVMGGCNATAPPVDAAGGDSVNGPTDNSDPNSPDAEEDPSLVVTHDDSADSDTLLDAADPESELSIKVTGTKDADGEIVEITGLEGTTEDGTAFTISWEAGGRLVLEADDLYVTAEETDEGGFVTEFTAGESGRVAGSAHKLGEQSKLAEVPWWILNQACEDYRDGGRPYALVRDVCLAASLAETHWCLANVFQFECMDEDQLTDAQNARCFRLAAIVDAIGQVVEAVVRSNPDLPADLRGLHVTVFDETCLGYSADGSELAYGLEVFCPTEVYVGHYVVCTAAPTGYADLNFTLHAHTTTMAIELRESDYGEHSFLLWGRRPSTTQICLWATPDGGSEVLAFRALEIKVKSAPFRITSVAPDPEHPTDQLLVHWTGNLELPASLIFCPRSDLTDTRGGYLLYENPQAIPLSWLCEDLETNSFQVYIDDTDSGAKSEVVSGSLTCPGSQ